MAGCETKMVLRTVLPRPPKYMGMQCLFIYLVCDEVNCSSWVAPMRQ